MGSNKSLLKIGGKTLIEITFDLMRSSFEKNILITNEPDEYKFLGIDIYTDIIPHLGPLSGIHSGLVNSETEKIFVISCDMPLMKSELINYIAEYKSEAEIVIPSDGKKIQPLCGIYKESLKVKIEKMLMNDSDLNEKKNRSGYHLIEKSNSEIVDVSKLTFFNTDLFFNLNSPFDYSKLRNLFDTEN